MTIVRRSLMLTRWSGRLKRFNQGVLAMAVAGGTCAYGQANLPIYTDRLVNGFDDWSWAPRSLTNTAPVHAGDCSISVTASVWQALSVHHAPLNTSLYDSLSFWINGGMNGGQVLQIQALLNGIAPKTRALPALPPNTWRQFTIPLTQLGADNQPDLDRINFQLTAGGSANPFFVDDIQLTAKPGPALVHLSINATQSVRRVDARWFGVNTAVWDRYLDTPETASLFREMGARALRFPGGSLSDEYHWESNTIGTNSWKWVASFDRFAHTATNIGAQVFLTVNYGTGTPAEAAAGVRYANHTNRYGFQYWEIGNENYGSWETDSNTNPHDPYTLPGRQPGPTHANRVQRFGMVGSPEWPR